MKNYIKMFMEENGIEYNEMFQVNNANWRAPIQYFIGANNELTNRSTREIEKELFKELLTGNEEYKIELLPKRTSENEFTGSIEAIAKLIYDTCYELGGNFKNTFEKIDFIHSDDSEGDIHFGLTTLNVFDESSEHIETFYANSYGGGNGTTVHIYPDDAEKDVVSYIARLMVKVIGNYGLSCDVNKTKIKAEFHFKDEKEI